MVESEHASLPLEGWLLRVDPATDQLRGAVSPPGGPSAIMGGDATPPSVLVAGHDAVYVSDPSTGVVWQVDPRRHRLRGSVAVIQGGPLAAAAGRLVPLTGPHAGEDGPRLPDPLGHWITGLAAGAGTLWLATSDALYRVDPRALG